MQEAYNQNLENYNNCLSNLQSKLKESISIPHHSITGRVKELSSLQRKSIKKNYSDISQCTDIVACKINFFSKDQINEALPILKDKFRIVESFSKQGGTKEFAYQSHHLIIDFDNMPCEIQLRTILQDAWAEMEHKINYKDSGADEVLQRKINRLSALFEIADEQFQEIYQKSNKIVNLEVNDLNKTTLTNFCKKNFSWAFDNIKFFPELTHESHFEELTNILTENRIITIQQLQDLYNNKIKEIEEDESIHIQGVLQNKPPFIYDKVRATNHFYSPKSVIKMLLS